MEILGQLAHDLEFRIISGNFSEINDTLIVQKNSLMVATMTSGSVGRQEEKHNPLGEIGYINYGYRDSERCFQIVFKS